MAEESLAFYALIITVMIAAGYDALVGALRYFCSAAGIGVLGSTINPFATGIASGFAGVPISDGLVGRVVILVVGSRHRHLVGDALRGASAEGPHAVDGVRHEGDERGAFDAAGVDETGGAERMTGRHKVILAMFVLAFVVMIYGVIPWSDLGIAGSPRCGGGSRR